jgi:hypothetical protein
VTSTTSPSTVTAEAKALRAPHQRGQHLAGLVAVIINRLLAQIKSRLFLIGQRLEILATASGSAISSVCTRWPVRTHGQRRTQGFRALAGPTETATTSVATRLFLQAHSFLDGDLIEGVDAHLYIRQIHPEPLGFTRGRRCNRSPF